MTDAHRSGEQALAFSLDDDLRLRQLEESDADELYAVVAASRDHLAQWMPWAAGQTLQGTLEFIRRARAQPAENMGFQTAIVDRDQIVGTIGFHRVDWENRSTSIGYWIARRAQGRGIVTRAVRALTDHAFETWKLNRVEIRAGVDNSRSRAIPERLGYVHEGVLREAELVGGRFVDHAVYSMLAADWASAPLIYRDRVMADQPALPLAGGCNCGAVRFEIDAPLGGAMYCHCKRCQRRTGTAASANASVEPGSFRLLSGEDRLGAWKPEGGAEKWFCGDCGSAMFSRDPDDGHVGIRLGVLDDDPGVRPGAHQFVAYAAPWEPIPDDGLPRHPESRSQS